MKNRKQFFSVIITMLIAMTPACAGNLAGLGNVNLASVSGSASPSVSVAPASASATPSTVIQAPVATPSATSSMDPVEASRSIFLSAPNGTTFDVGDEPLVYVQYKRVQWKPDVSYSIFVIWTSGAQGSREIKKNDPPIFSVKHTPVSDKMAGKTLTASIYLQGDGFQSSDIATISFAIRVPATPTPAPTPSPTPVPTPTPTPDASASATPVPTPTPVATPTPAPTPSPTPSPSQSPGTTIN